MSLQRRPSTSQTSIPLPEDPPASSNTDRHNGPGRGVKADGIRSMDGPGRSSVSQEGSNGVIVSSSGLTYRDRIFEYHVAAPLLLRAIDNAHPNKIPQSALYRTVSVHVVDGEDPALVDYWRELCEHDRAWFVQNLGSLVKSSSLSGRLVEDDDGALNRMMTSTPELDRLVTHDEWMGMIRNAAVTRWDGSTRYDDLLRAYGLPVNALTMWQVTALRPEDFDGAWDSLLDDWRFAARDEGLDPESMEDPKPDWFYRLEAKSRGEDWFLRKAKKQEDEELQEAMESVEEDRGSGDGSWNGGDGMDTSYGSSYDAAYDPSYDGGDWFDGGHEDDGVPGIESEAPVEEAGVFRGTPDGLEDLDRALAGEIYARSGRKVIPCDHPGEDERPSWDLGNGIIGADA